MELFRVIEKLKQQKISVWTFVKGTEFNKK